MIANPWIAPTRPTYGSPRFDPDSEPRRLRITVVFNTIEGTLSALDAASSLARELGAEILLLVTEVVSFRYPLESPPGDWHFFERLCDALLDQAAGTRTRSEVHFCRDIYECLQQTLAPHSLVLVGARRRRWCGLERDLHRTLLRLGHDVLLVPCSGTSERTRSVIERLLNAQIAA